MLTILVLSALVLLHELGHFLVARRNGVEVEEFGFGFPPRIIAWRSKKVRGGKGSPSQILSNKVFAFIVLF